MLTIYNWVLWGRDIYNEGIHSVITVRDFTQIFDAYSQYEETMIQSKMESTTELTEEGMRIVLYLMMYVYYSGYISSV